MVGGVGGGRRRSVIVAVIVVVVAGVVGGAERADVDAVVREETGKVRGKSDAGVGSGRSAGGREIGRRKRRNGSAVGAQRAHGIVETGVRTTATSATATAAAAAAAAIPGAVAAVH